MTEYLKVEDVCERFHVTRRTVYRWIEAGRLHPLKAGKRFLFTEDDVDLAAGVTQATRSGDEDQDAAVRRRKAAAHASRRGFAAPRAYAELMAAGLTYDDAAAACGKTAREVAAAVEDGADTISVMDALAIRDSLFPSLTLEELFRPAGPMSVNAR